MFAADSRKRVLTPSVISGNIQWGKCRTYFFAPPSVFWTWVCTLLSESFCFNWDFLAVSAWYQVINDLLDPTGQNLRVREDAQVSYNLTYSYVDWNRNLIYNFGFILFISLHELFLTLFSVVFQYMNSDISNCLCNVAWRVCMDFGLQNFLFVTIDCNWFWCLILIFFFTFLSSPLQYCIHVLK